MRIDNLVEAIAIEDLTLGDPIILKDGVAVRAKVSDLSSGIFHCADLRVREGALGHFANKDTVYHIDI